MSESGESSSGVEHDAASIVPSMIVYLVLLSPRPIHANGSQEINKP